MRISDWSSDVCSSDLMRLPELSAQLPVVRLEDAGMARQMAEYVLHGIVQASRQFSDYAALQQAGQWRQLPPIRYADWPVGIMGLGAIDRKSVVKGKSVSVRVDLGGRRIIKKQTIEQNTKTTRY